MLSILTGLCGSKIFYQKMHLTPWTLPVGVRLGGVCVWQLLNGLCLILLPRKWTWHYSSITTIPPLISLFLLSLPPFSLCHPSCCTFSSLWLFLFMSPLYSPLCVFDLIYLFCCTSFFPCFLFFLCSATFNFVCVQYVPYFLISLPFFVSRLSSHFYSKLQHFLFSASASLPSICFISYSLTVSLSLCFYQSPNMLHSIILFLHSSSSLLIS